MSAAVGETEAGPTPAGPLVLGMPGPTLACLAACVAGLVALVAIVLSSDNKLWYDETWYLNSVPELHKLGLSRAFLRSLPGPAGPLYAVVHALFEPLTGLRAPGVRLVTIGFALLTFAALGAAMRERGIPYAFPKAMGLIAAPMMFGPIGTAMTEMPAAFFFCTGLALLLASLRRAEQGKSGASALAALAGLACGVAITGRQQYLIAPLLAVVVWRRATWRPALIFSAVALAVPAPMFAAWGGMLPPLTDYVGSGISVAHGLLSFSYAGFVYCLYDVGWLLRHWRLNLALVALTTALNVACGFLKVVPFLKIAEKLEPTVRHYYALVGCGFMLGFGVMLGVLLARLAWERRHDRVFLFLCAMCAALLTAPAKITHAFMGRYIATALPILVLIANERRPDTYGRAVRLALGCVAGALSLAAYLSML